jgi:hypothetical protein
MLEFIGLCALLVIAYKVLPDLVAVIVKIILGVVIGILILNVFIAVWEPTLLVINF